MRPVRLAITLGDAAGIGPEIITKALRAGSFEDVTLFGAPGLVPADAARLVDVSGTDSLIDVEPGLSDPRCARLQLRALETAIEAAKRDEIDAIVTAPWTKALFETIGAPALGHTEVLADRFGVGDEHVMMLAGDVLRVALVTTHIPLRQVSERVTEKAILHTIRVTAHELRRSFGIPEPRIAVCGVNPHAGEGGHMGTEDRDVVEPALEQARQLGFDVHGPFPADTLFVKFRGEVAPYDAVVAMYHDQGLTPLKLRHFGESANITLGLPTVRTSVDHGTAYDIAGKGIADASSMRYALELAERLVRNRQSE